jgi:hypothetical protein
MGIRWQAKPLESESGVVLAVGMVGAWRVSVRVGVRSQDRGALDLRIEPIGGVVPGGLSTSDCRVIDIGGAVRAARMALAPASSDRPGPGLIRRLTTASGEEVPEGERRSASFSRLERLAMVALDYDQCLAQGRTDANAYIREHWGVSEPKAREWIRAARRSGLLTGGTSRGRAAGVLDYARWQEIMGGVWIAAHPATRSAD